MGLSCLINSSFGLNLHPNIKIPHRKTLANIEPDTVELDARKSDSDEELFDILF